MQNGYRCGRASILFAVVATDLLLHHGVDGFAIVHCGCGAAAKDKHHQDHERIDRWTEESCCEDAASHSIVLYPNEP